MNILKDYSPLISLIISVLGSWLVAWHTAKLEIRKAQVRFKREDELALREAYTSMIHALEHYAFGKDEYCRVDAIKATTQFSYLAPDSCKPSLSRVAHALHEEDPNAVKCLLDNLSNEILPKIKCAGNNTKNKQTGIK